MVSAETGLRAGAQSPSVDADALRADSLRLMLFTDTLADVNGVSRFIRDMGEQAAAVGRELLIATSTRLTPPDRPHIVNVRPLLAGAMPGYETLQLAVPPARALLRVAAAFRPDVIHISTPGPVGLAGLLAARRLGCPVAGVYHTDFPAYIDHLFGDAAYTAITRGFMRFVYGRFARIFSRSEEYMQSLAALGIRRERMVRLLPGIALESFRASARDPSIWTHFGVDAGPVKLLYVGRISVEKNLPLLAAIWPRLRAAAAAAGRAVELILIGDGPYRAAMQQGLAGQGAHFLGFRHGDELAALYASSDLFIFPSLTDTLGQVVLESQSSGLPVLVSDEGGPREVVAAGVTGFVLPGREPAEWEAAALRLVLDETLRRRMGAAAQIHAQRFTIQATFEQFWAEHAALARAGGMAARSGARPAPQEARSR